MIAAQAARRRWRERRGLRGERRGGGGAERDRSIPARRDMLSNVERSTSNVQRRMGAAGGGRKVRSRKYPPRRTGSGRRAREGASAEQVPRLKGGRRASFRQCRPFGTPECTVRAHAYLGLASQATRCRRVATGKECLLLPRPLVATATRLVLPARRDFASPQCLWFRTSLREFGTA
jgi:hypothetical protein